MVATVFVTPFRLRIIRNEQGLLPLDETRSKGNLLEDLDFVLTNVMPVQFSKANWNSSL